MLNCPNRVGTVQSLFLAQGCSVVCEGAVGPAPVPHKISQALNPALFPLVFVGYLLPMLAIQKGGMTAHGSHTRIPVGAQHAGMIDGVCGVECEGP